jgi:hypothetical protein
MIVFSATLPLDNQVVKPSKAQPPRHYHSHYYDIGTLPVRTLALAGLALFKRDPALTATVAQLLRKALRFNIWFNRLFCAHLNLLLQEPGSDVLAPIRDVLVSNSIRK